MKYEKIIIYMGGGSMAGIFSGGVVTQLQEIDFYKNIEAIYAGSAGAMNSAYFLSRQTKLGATIYFEDLTHDFILPKNIPIGIAKLIWSKYVHGLPKDSTRYAVNIDYALDLIRNRKRLFTDVIKKQPIGFYVKLMDIKTGEIKYLDAKEYDIFSLLRAASCCLPYYPFSEKIGGGEYVDGTIPEPIGLQYLLDRYPTHKIVVIVNNFLRRKFSNTLRCFAEGIVGQFCDHTPFGMYMNRERSLRNDLQLAFNTPRVLLICPPENSPAIAMTQDKEKLMTSFNIGKEMACKIEEFARSK